MNIIFGTENATPLMDKYTVLELDTLDFVNMDKIVTLYIVVEQAKVEDMPNLERWTRMHAALVTGYKTKNFDLCMELVPHLLGTFDSEVDTFYKMLFARIEDIKDTELDDAWSPNIEITDEKLDMPIKASI